MHIVLAVGWHVIIQHYVHRGDVQPARCHISAHEDAALPRLGGAGAGAGAVAGCGACKHSQRGSVPGQGELTSFPSATGTPLSTDRACTLNLFSAARRLGCDIWPWMGMAPKPRLRSINASLRVESHVRVKSIAVDPASSVQVQRRAAAAHFSKLCRSPSGLCSAAAHS